MAFAYCPECRARIDLKRKVSIGRPVTCPCCDAVLRVIDLNPLQLNWIDYAANGDWQEDWEVELEKV